MKKAPENKQPTSNEHQTTNNKQQQQKVTETGHYQSVLSPARFLRVS